MGILVCRECGGTSSEFNARCTACGAQLPDCSETTLPSARGADADEGSLVGRAVASFDVDAILGAGAMAVVYRAVDRRLGRPVALKVLTTERCGSERAKARFVREARAASRLDHPNVGTVYEIGEHEGRPFIAMALYEGETLRQRLERGSLAVEEAVVVASQIASGLAAAHAAGIIHRDVKPANVVVTRSGIVKLLDFGLAKVAPVGNADAAGLTRGGTILGTPAYMAPEQLRGDEADARADLWSLGIVAHEMIAGRAPFLADDVAAVADAILGDALPSLPHVPPAFGDLLDRLCRKAPHERPESAEEVAHALAGIAADLGAQRALRLTPPGRSEVAAERVVAERFRLVRELGSGGMGSVWLAHHLGLDAPCAIKFIHDDRGSPTELRARFEREARAAAQLKSPHVVKVLDYGVWNERPYLVMEHLEGEDLDARLERLERLDPGAVLDVVRHIARGLEVAHAAGVVHRDLKPANVFLAREGDGEIAKILDFGIAKSTATDVDGSSIGTASLLGTPSYMSPEQADGTRVVDHRSDLWSLAVIVFRCLTGRLPFESRAVGDLLVQILTKPAPLPSTVAPGLPASIDAWWRRAAARDPDARFQSARELADAFATSLEGATMTSPSARRRRWIAVLAAGCAATLGTLALADRGRAPVAFAPSPVATEVVGEAQSTQAITPAEAPSAASLPLPAPPSSSAPPAAPPPRLARPAPTATPSAEPSGLRPNFDLRH
jgi:eukaryotic-like serine/threonine-protein kinase